MTVRILRLSLAATAAAGLLALTGCTIELGDSADPTPSPATSASTQPTASATAEPAAEGGEIPNPCELLTPADVNQLTGREITQIDRDSSGPGETRTCQWQLEQGVLAVFLSKTSESDFAVRDPAAVDVDGIGDDAYTSAGHLFVRSGELAIDVYATGATDDTGNEAVATATVENLIGKV
jgi:hypothetical protein